MPQDAAFCEVSCGSILSRTPQNEINHSAKRGKMRKIEAAKSSRKVVKRDFSTTGISASRIPYAALPGQQKNRPLFAAGVDFVVHLSYCIYCTRIHTSMLPGERLAQAKYGIAFS